MTDIDTLASLLAETGMEEDVSDTTENALEAFDEFAMGVGLFAPAILTLPAFTKLYDAMQDVRAEAMRDD
jgi:hypothetical protein